VKDLNFDSVDIIIIIKNIYLCICVCKNSQKERKVAPKKEKSLSTILF